MGEKRILIYSGTTEGRELAEDLAEAGVQSCVCVATEYGAEMMEPSSYVEVLTGRQNREEMISHMRSGKYELTVDATHPFATVVSAEVRAAAEASGLPYLRLARRTDAGTELPEDTVIVSSSKEAAEYLAGQEGKIFLTTGSKELPIIADAVGDPSRLIARVLPDAASIEICLKSGLERKQIIAMQGPFGKEINKVMLRDSGASWLLTKETGRTGGYADKILAAVETGVRLIVIRNPEQGKEENLTPVQVREVLSKRLGIDLSGKARCCTGEVSALDGTPLPEEKKTLSLCGIGVGSDAYMTKAVHDAAEQADVIYGAPRILESLAFSSAKKVPYYLSKDILADLSAHPEYTHACVAFSGDTGFYSGASGMLADIPIRGGEGMQGRSVEVLCGISALSYFASKAGIPWQDWKILSIHGRACNYLPQIRKHAKVYLLMSGPGDVRRVAEDILDAQEKGILGEVSVIRGFQLSYPEEEVRKMSPAELAKTSREGLYVLLVLHAAADRMPVVPGLPDEAFLRDKVPMTKEEIRALSICKLQLTEKAVVYDIGAGSGSVSIEAARIAADGMVYAVEQKDTALELIRKNADHFAVKNLEIISAKAPDGLKDLPAPTHVFIGGSSGNLREILETVLDKNPGVRIVINCITLETLLEAKACLDGLPVTEAEYVQIQASRAEILGRYHLMRAQNPVFIISCTGKG